MGAVVQMQPRARRARMALILTQAMLDLQHIANATRGAEGMLPMAAAQVLEAMLHEDPAALSEAMRGLIFEMRAANEEGLR